MKNLLVLAIALSSILAFAGPNNTHAHTAAVRACSKEFKRDKAKIKNCVMEKTKIVTKQAPAAPAVVK